MIRVCYDMHITCIKEDKVKKLIPLIIIGVLLASLILASCGGGSNSYKVATDATWAPFEYVDEQSKDIVGFDIDLLNAIAKNQNIKIEYVNVAFDPLLAGMSQGQYDAAISSITITDARKKDMLFSDPYFEAGQIIVVQKNNTTITSKDNLSGQVGAQLGTTGADEVEKIKTATVKKYDDIGLAFQDLMNGQIAAVVCDNPVALGYVGKNPDKLKTVGTAFTDENYGIAVAKGKTDLVNKINAGIKAVKSEGLIDQFSQKWLEK
jgi:polar amino acid transport system substrate-binding protein